MPETFEVDVRVHFTDVFKILVSLNVEKYPGIDKSTPRVLQNYAESLTKPIHHLFSQLLLYLLVGTKLCLFPKLVIQT